MFLKRFLSRILSLDAYLRIVSSFFFRGYFSGLLKNKSAFELHYFVKKLIRPGDVIIDIGANLGYYAVLFGRFTGRKGKVYAVEPVSLYRKVLERNIRKRNPYRNITILPFALGTEDNKQIRLGVPTGNSHFRHGLTRVVQNEEQQNSVEFTEIMMRPQTLFGQLDRTDYIKCDVEGYEIFVVPEILFLVEKHKPLLQIETDGKNRDEITKMLTPFGYKPFYVMKKKIYPLTGGETIHTGDVLYIPKERMEQVKNLMA
jgi:FkbM family methyltransferase